MEAQHGKPGGAPPTALVLELVFEPILGQVSLIREFVERYFRAAVDDADLLCRMTVAVHELLENALKYSAGGMSRLRIEVTRSHATDALSVSVANLGSPDHLPALTAIIEDLSSAGDVDALYQRYLTQAAQRTEGSGLGLARIRVEAEMDLRLQVSGEMVYVEAVARFEQETGT